MDDRSVVILAILSALFACRTVGTLESSVSNSREVDPSSLLSENKDCLNTIQHCASCLDHRTCQICQKGFALLESYWGGLCVVNCPKDFTKIDTSANGALCRSIKGCSKIPNCSQCEENFGDICDACQEGFLLFQRETGAKVQCVASCPAGFVKHGKRCRSEMCEDFFCSRCKPGLVLRYLGGTTCLAKCPSGFYMKEDVFSGQAYCDMCRRNCKSCQDSYNCDVCEDEYFLFKGVFSKCMQSCPSGYKVNQNQSLGNVCFKDKLGCLDESCFKCREDWYRIRIRKDYHCRKECPGGYFGVEGVEKAKICSRCPYNCQTCLSRRACLQCKPGLFKLEHDGAKFCVWHCPQHFKTQYDEMEQKTCVKETDNLLGRL